MVICCSCCRRTEQNYLDFDPDDIDGLIEECIKIARYNDWDFGCNTFRGLPDDMDEGALEGQIEQAVNRAKESYDHAEEIKRLEKEVRDIDDWFESLELSKVKNTERRVKLQQRLNEMKGSL